MKQYQPLPDDYVLITGATSGIGLALAREFAARGRRLILVGRNLSRLKKTAKELDRGTVGVTACIASDLSLPGSAERLYRTLRKDKYPVETLINNAGMGLKGEAQTEHSLKESRTLFQLNCQTPMELASLFGKDMVAKGHGRILNIASTAAYQPMPYTALYGAGKAFLLSLSEAMHSELKNSGVTVTAISPGLTDTNFFQHGKPHVPGWLYPFISPELVARKAIRALEKGKASTIPCFRHWLFAQLYRVLPRRRMLGVMKMIEKMRKQIK